MVLNVSFVLLMAPLALVLYHRMREPTNFAALAVLGAASVLSAIIAGSLLADGSPWLLLLQAVIIVPPVVWGLRRKRRLTEDVPGS